MADCKEESMNLVTSTKNRKQKKNRNSKGKSSPLFGSNEGGNSENDTNQVSLRNSTSPTNGTAIKNSKLLHRKTCPISPNEDLLCSQCDITFSDKTKYQRHMQLARHRSNVKFQDHRWSFRCPPRGLLAYEYSICQAFLEKKTCQLGDRCIEAHGEEELKEWKERFSYHSSKIEKDSAREMSYTEKLLQEISNLSDNDNILSNKIEGLTCNINSNLEINLSSKLSDHTWIFHIKYPFSLNSVALLYDSHRSNFSIIKVTIIETKPLSHRTCLPPGGQEWVNESHIKNPSCAEYKIEINFKTEIYGTFRQDVVFDFGIRPILKQSLCVNCISINDVKNTDSKQSIIISRTEMWSKENCDIVEFEPKVDLEPSAQRLLNKYPIPNNLCFQIGQSTLDKVGTKSSYRERMHNLLTIEEIEHFNLISQFNIRTSLLLTEKYCLFPSTSSVSKYASPGELYGRLTLSSEISEDSPHGRLILNCSSVLLSTGDEIGDKNCQSRRRAYEALIEDKTKNEIFIRLSSKIVDDLNLQDEEGEEEEMTFDIQFQLNRLPMCEMHEGLDRFSAFDILYPPITSHLTIPWNPAKHWSDLHTIKLNPKQKEALMAISAPPDIQLPPILLIGPFGTGKTYTLGQTINYLMEHCEDSRILVCTHSNSAADIYIKDYLHPHYEKGQLKTKPLRIYYHKRWVPTVHKTVQKYCLVVKTEKSQSFRQPTKDDILAHRIIITTINTSMILANLDIPKDFFTHILIDEAAQIIEAATLIPLSLANGKTRVVLAGDYMQLSQEVFSPFCKERCLHVSLLERLYEMYPSDYVCKIMLVENYRSHHSIIQFTSNLFYDRKLVSKERISAHPNFHPLSFFTAKGEDVQDRSSTSFYNDAEVSEVCELVEKLVETWPISSWGPLDENSIGVVTPYTDQVLKIRTKLKQKRFMKISVERVLNVQGKEFRIVILSTVRTRNTCAENDVSLDFGFLSNAKLLTTAITRAQSMVAVVGDPISLSSVGKCRKIWEEFLTECVGSFSLHGISWAEIRSQLDGIELQKIYGLNPNAKEFIPRYSVYPPVFPIVSPIVNPLIVPQQNIIMPYNPQILLQSSVPFYPGFIPRQQLPVVYMPPLSMPVNPVGFNAPRQLVPFNSQARTNVFPYASFPNTVPRMSPMVAVNFRNSQNLIPYEGIPLVGDFNPRTRGFYPVPMQNLNPSSINPTTPEQKPRLHDPQLLNDKIKFRSNVHFPNSTKNIVTDSATSSVSSTNLNCTSENLFSRSQAHKSEATSRLKHEQSPAVLPNRNYTYNFQNKDNAITSASSTSEDCSTPKSILDGSLGHSASPRGSSESETNNSENHHEIELIHSLTKMLNDTSNKEEEIVTKKQPYSSNEKHMPVDGLNSTLSPLFSNAAMEYRRRQDTNADRFSSIMQEDKNKASQNYDSKFLLENNLTCSPLRRDSLKMPEMSGWNNLSPLSLRNNPSFLAHDASSFSVDDLSRRNVFEFNASPSGNHWPLYLRKGVQPANNETSRNLDLSQSLQKDTSSGWSQETKARLPPVSDDIPANAEQLNNGDLSGDDETDNSEHRTYAGALRSFPKQSR